MWHKWPISISLSLPPPGRGQLFHFTSDNKVNCYYERLKILEHFGKKQGLLEGGPVDKCEREARESDHIYLHKT